MVVTEWVDCVSQYAAASVEDVLPHENHKILHYVAILLLPPASCTVGTGSLYRA